jgi:hypothetical protein
MPGITRQKCFHHLIEHSEGACEIDIGHGKRLRAIPVLRRHRPIDPR